jgi:hypothetical protein
MITCSTNTGKDKCKIASVSVCVRACMSVGGGGGGGAMKVCREHGSKVHAFLMN